MFTHADTNHHPIPDFTLMLCICASVLHGLLVVTMLNFVLVVLWFVMWLTILRFFIIVSLFLSSPPLSGCVRKQKKMNTNSLVTKDTSTKSMTWQSDCWPQACPSDSSQDVVYLFLFIALCLKLYSSALFAVSSVHSLHISLWFPLQIPGVCRITAYPYPPLPTVHSYFTVLHWILAVMVHIWQIFWMCQNIFSSRHSYSP